MASATIPPSSSGYRNAGRDTGGRGHGPAPAIFFIPALAIPPRIEEHQEPAYVLATVEDVRAVGINQYTRANYYTDKTMEFTGAKTLGELVAHQLRH